MNSSLAIPVQQQSVMEAAVTNEYPIYPKLGILATCIGTAIAILLMPENPQPAGALYQSAVAMTIGLALAPLLAALRRPRTILRAEHLLALSPIYWLLLDLLQSAYGLVLVDRTAVQSAFFAIGLFIVGVWIASLAKPWPLPKALLRSATQPINVNIIAGLIVLLFILGMFKFAYPTGFNPSRMIYYLGVNRWAAPWSRGAFGSWDAFLDHMSYFGYLLPTLTVLLAQRSRWFSLKTILAIVLSLIMIAFLAHGGGRRVIGVVLGAAIIVWILEQKQFKTRQMITMVISTVILLLLMQYMLEYRNIGYQSLITNPKERQYTHLHVDDNFLRLGQVIYLVPRYHSFVYEQQIVYTLVRPIPRVFWPGKPTGPGFDLTAAIGQSGFSLTTSVIGEWYLSFGWIMILLGGWFYGQLAHAVSVVLVGSEKSARTVVYSLSAMTLFAGMRSMLDLVSMSYALLAWIFISSFIADRSKETKSF